MNKITEGGFKSKLRWGNLFLKWYCAQQSMSNIGGSRGTTSTHPPTGSNSFVFAHVLAERHVCQRSAPLPNGSAPPPQREILDPPLSNHFAKWQFVLNFANLEKSLIQRILHIVVAKTYQKITTSVINVMSWDIDCSRKRCFYANSVNSQVTVNQFRNKRLKSRTIKLKD